MLPPKENVGAEVTAGGFCDVAAGAGAGLTEAVLAPPNEKLVVLVVDALLDESPPNEKVGFAALGSEDEAALDVRLPKEIVELVLLGSSPLDDKLFKGLSNVPPKFKVGLTSFGFVMGGGAAGDSDLTVAAPKVKPGLGSFSEDVPLPPKRDLTTLESVEMGASRALGLGKDLGVSTEVAGVFNCTFAGAAARVVAASKGAVFSFSAVGNTTVFVTSALLDEEFILGLAVAGSLAGFMDGLVFSSSL